MRPVTITPSNVIASLLEIQRASHDGDVVEIAKNFSFDVSPTQTLQLLVSAPTLSNTNLVLATLLNIMQKGGLSRTT
jgi:hypothetical protein